MNPGGATRPWRIAIASGKGGTGKTTVAIHLARALADGGRPVTLVDADAEAPNLHCFLPLQAIACNNVDQLVPRIDGSRCTACGRCVEACAFNALVLVKGAVTVHGDLCHGCGVCTLVCPAQAISETPRHIGAVHHDVASRNHDTPVITARTAIGTTRTPAVINAAKAQAATDRIQIIDGPPGTACPAVAAVRGADLVLLVTEATAFGLHDLALAVELVRTLGCDHAVVVNRATSDRRVQDWCVEQGIRVLAEIPQDRRVAETYAQGLLPGQMVPGYARRFADLAVQVLKRLTARSAA